MSVIHSALLRLPTRRATFLPELLRHFGAGKPGGDHDGLMRFLRAFSGATLVIPDPRQMADLERDVEMARALLGIENDEDLAEWLEDQKPFPLSPLMIIDLCREHKVTYEHVEQVYLAVTGKPIHAMHNGTCEGKVHAAAKALMERAGSERIVQAMFDLSAPQMKAVRAKKGKV